VSSVTLKTLDGTSLKKSAGKIEVKTLHSES